MEAEDVSLDLLFDAVRRDPTGCVEVIGGEAILELLAATRIRTPGELREYLRTILGGAGTERWKKSPTRKRPQTGPKRASICGGHTSVDKILRGAHKEIPFGRKNAKSKPEEPPPFETEKHS